MKIVVVKFPSLTDLAAYLKLVHPKAYTINTVQLTITARFTDFELGIAIEQFGGIETQHQTAV